MGPQTLTRGSSSPGQRLDTFAFYGNSVDPCCFQHCARHPGVEDKGQVWPCILGRVSGCRGGAESSPRPCVLRAQG